MDGTQVPINPYLQRAVQTALESHQRVTSFTRLRGGSKKGVYRAILGDRSVIAYVWAESENYWPAPDPATADADDPFADASGAERFEQAHQCLRALDVRIPDLLFLARSRAELQADVAIVEDIPGGALQDHWQRHPHDAARITSELGAMLKTIHARHSSQVGKLADIDRRPPQGVRSEDLVLARALGHLDHAAEHIDELRDAQEELERALRSMATGLQSRSEYGLIHGELGPDHVLVDAQGHPAIIDIEGLMFFDIEWEHAFLRFRFGEHYRHLREDELDEARLAFYTLCLHVSLCSGPLRLLQSKYPDRQEVLDIVEWNASKALDFVR
jgi:aminoglycoside phosphotransferase (APT) family kinase protein